MHTYLHTPDTDGIDSNRSSDRSTVTHRTPLGAYRAGVRLAHRESQRSMRSMRSSSTGDPSNSTETYPVGVAEMLNQAVELSRHDRSEDDSDPVSGSPAGSMRAFYPEPTASERGSLVAPPEDDDNLSAFSLNQVASTVSTGSDFVIRGRPGMSPMLSVPTAVLGPLSNRSLPHHHVPRTAASSHRLGTIRTGGLEAAAAAPPPAGP